MKIKDIDGNELEIVNLQQAIRQAKEFAGYSIDNNNKSQIKQKKYWNHLYESLIKLKFY